jgi:glycosyltransferase involved in cell wall biosynthesis
LNYPTVSVLIPSFGRPDRLLACLAALAKQIIPPQEVLVVWQDADFPTRDAIAGVRSKLPYRLLDLHNPERGIVPAENLALANASGEVIALIDDDAVPPPDWLRRHLEFYADPRVGAVGGPADNRYPDGALYPRRAVEPLGRLTFFGKVHGNMHTQALEWRNRPPATVDHLVGYNMTLRRKAFDCFESRLRPYWQSFELDACLQVKARGFRVVFDFANVIEHYPSGVAYRGGRDGDLCLKIYNGAFNMALVLAKHSSLPLRPLRLANLLLVGSVSCPGLLGACVGFRRYGNLRREVTVLLRTWGAVLSGWRRGSSLRSRLHHDKFIGRKAGEIPARLAFHSTQVNSSAFTTPIRSP